MKSSINHLMEASLPILITYIHPDDIKEVARIHAQQFPRQNDSITWIKCNFSAFPRIMIFVARDEKDKVVGYIQWVQKSGFRKEVVLELEQIAVLQDRQNQGIGTTLIKNSLQSLKTYFDDNGSIIKTIIVSTRSDNKAQSLYKNVLKASPIAMIPALYSHDEVIMIAKDFF